MNETFIPEAFILHNLGLYKALYDLIKLLS